MANIYLLNEGQMQMLCDKLCAWSKDIPNSFTNVGKLIDMLMKIPSIKEEEIKTLADISGKINGLMKQ